MAASKFKLDNLVAILDRNRIQQDGFTEEIMPLDPVRDKWTAFNWNVVEVNGHKIEEIIDALSRVEKVEDKPSIIIANTTKGKGIKHMANSPQWHDRYLELLMNVLIALIHTITKHAIDDIFENLYHYSILRRA